MSEFYDSLETRDPLDRERDLFLKLPDQVAHARESAPAYRSLFADIDPRAVIDRSSLAQLPITRKSEMTDRQSQSPPFGGFMAEDLSGPLRVFASPGPIYEPAGMEENFGRMARALYCAGFRAGDLAYNTFSYHFTPAGHIFESGALALGCRVFAAGVGQTELQARTIADLRPQGYIGTPSFLGIILDKAEELQLDLSNLTKGLVTGEALPSSLRATIADRGVSLLECYSTADLGLIAYETPSHEGLVVDEGIILEIVRPGTGDPVAEGEVGEVVVTTFDKTYPLVRFATGDLSATLPGTSPCGRTNVRIRGWLGRADQTTKVRGMFVHPSQVAALVDRHPEIIRARLVVDRSDNNDQMTLHCEVETVDASLEAAIVESLRAVCKLRGGVSFTAPDTLPNDGKVIDDIRSYE